MQTKKGVSLSSRGKIKDRGGTMNLFGLAMGALTVFVAFVSLPAALGLMMFWMFELMEESHEKA
jgi:hypothetical protein